MEKDQAEEASKKVGEYYAAQDMTSSDTKEETKEKIKDEEIEDSDEEVCNFFTIILLTLLYRSIPSLRIILWTQVIVSRIISFPLEESTLKNMTEKYLKYCIKYKKEKCINECNRILGKLGYSELETSFPKIDHSLTATKDFVFITGGSYNEGEDRSFEILCLSNDTLFRGPDLVQNRACHCSFIIDYHLYVMFGSVLNSFAPSMSYEVIEIPPVGNTDTLEVFYKNRRWKDFKLPDMEIHPDFKVFNSFRTFENEIYCFGIIGK